MSSATFAGMNSHLSRLPTNSFIKIQKDLLIEAGSREIDLGWTFGEAEDTESKCSLQMKANYEEDRILEKGETFKVDDVEWLSSHEEDMSLKISLQGFPNNDYILFEWNETTGYSPKVKDIMSRCSNLFKVIIPPARSYSTGQRLRR